MSTRRAEELNALAESLNLSFKDWATFEELSEHLRAKEDWRALERVYRTMLGLVPASQASVEQDLHGRLLTLCRSRLKDRTAAIAVAEALTAKFPWDAGAQAQLAQLYEETKQPREAEARYAEVLRHRPGDQKAQRKLFELRRDRGATDGALVAAQVLLYRAPTEPDSPVREFCEQVAPKTLPALRKRLDADDWEQLRAEGEDPAMAAFFCALASPAIKARADCEEAAREVDPCYLPKSIENPSFRAVFAWALDALGLPFDRHIADDGKPGPGPTALVAGEPLDARHGDATLRRLLFLAGRLAANHRPWALLRARYASLRSLEVLYAAGLLLVDREGRAPRELVATSKALSAALRRVASPDELGSIRKAADALPAVTSLRRFADGMDLTASRAGLLLAGDLGTVKECLLSEVDAHAHPDRLDPAQTLEALESFMSSDEHLKLRATLGLAAHPV